MLDKKIVYGIGVVVLVGFSGVIFTLKQNNDNLVRTLQREKQSCIEKEKTYKNNSLKAQKIDAQMWIKQLDVLYTKRYDALDAQIQKELKDRVYKAYGDAKKVYDKYHKIKRKKDVKQRVKDTLEGRVFVTNFSTNSILMGNQKFGREDITNYVDADHRSIVLEELQKVRKRGEAFIKSRHAQDGSKEIIFVENLDMYDWFIGDNIFKKDKVKELNLSILKMLDVLPLNSSNFLALYDKDKKLLFSKNITKPVKFNLSESLKCYEDGNHNYCSSYIKGFDGYVVYGFKE